jgi:short-subunit dehydrogenase
LPGTLEDVVQELEQIGVAAVAVPADLAEVRSVEEIHQATTDRFGRCDVLINNAAYSPVHPLLEMSPSKWRAALTVNVWAPAALARLFLPEMVERGSGAVINVGSVASVASVPRAAPYCVSKAALERLTEVIDDEIAASGVITACVRIDERIQSESDSLMESLGVGAISAPSRTSPEQYARALEWLTSQPALGGRTLTLAELWDLGAMA